MTKWLQRPQNETPLPLWNEDVPFLEAGDDANLPRLTPFFADTEDVASAIVIYPGGGYAMRADHEGAPIARWLNTLGIHAFVADYRVAPYRHPVPMLDGQRAIRYVRYHADAWGVDKARIGVLGFSAGGHLAATVSTHFDDGATTQADAIDGVSSRPDLSVLCYAVISLHEHRHKGSVENLLGANPDPALLDDLSNERQITAATPPAFLWHTADDEAVAVANSLMYAAELGKRSIPFDLHVYEHGVHGLGLATQDPHVGSWTKTCAAWLRVRKFC
ncbi:alpha/beta hydrolase [Alicyclobacillus fodiniaquatilis]|uniref:Alpha/beta hydrolase n=1 Tax=Alicyclobacillus fodiniaquatilis TaxID=1661150 RepID=A0ABW4JCP9_9BACL